jgi:hypothetical protein
MKIVNNIGLIIFAVWLLVRGFVELFRLTFAGMDFILPLLAILAGVLLLLRIRESNVAINIGFLLLSVWLILTGAMPLLGVNIPELTIILSVLGLAAGVLLLMGQ